MYEFRTTIVITAAILIAFIAFVVGSTSIANHNSIKNVKQLELCLAAGGQFISDDCVK